MATISENLQIIKNSTDAIKQAIIDKGGTITGNISTWADAISGISGGGSGSEESEYTFTGTINYNMTTITISGNLNKVPDTGRNYLLLLGWFSGGLCYAFQYIGSVASYTLSIDFQEPLGYAEIPAMCILNIDGTTFTTIPVKFIRLPGGMSGGSDN